jgi:hypothetical protein
LVSGDISTPVSFHEIADREAGNIYFKLALKNYNVLKSSSCYNSTWDPSISGAQGGWGASCPPFVCQYLNNTIPQELFHDICVRQTNGKTFMDIAAHNVMLNSVELTELGNQTAQMLNNSLSDMFTIAGTVCAEMATKNNRQPRGPHFSGRAMLEKLVHSHQNFNLRCNNDVHHFEEHEHFQIVVTTEGKRYQGRHLVLAAGTVENKRIVHNSLSHNPHDSQGPTDHIIISGSCSFSKGSDQYKNWLNDTAKLFIFPKELSANVEHRFFVDLIINGEHFWESSPGQRFNQDDHKIMVMMVYLFGDKVRNSNTVMFGHDRKSTIIHHEDKRLSKQMEQAIVDFQNTLRQTLNCTSEPNHQPFVRGCLFSDNSLCYHQFGFVRHQGGDTNAMVDTNLQLIGHPNIYLLGTDVFGTILPQNPALYLSALAVRLAHHVADEL